MFFDLTSYRNMLNRKLSRLFFSNHLNSFVRYQTNVAQNDQTSKISNEKHDRDQHLSNITVTSFYSQSAIEHLAQKV